MPSLKGLGIFLFLPGTAVPGYRLLRPLGTGVTSHSTKRSRMRNARICYPADQCRVAKVISFEPPAPYFPNSEKRSAEHWQISIGVKT